MGDWPGWGEGGTTYMQTPGIPFSHTVYPLRSEISSQISPQMPGQKRKRCAYDAAFKLKVVAYATTHNNNSKAAREFNVCEKQVREWKKAASQLAELPKSKKACRGLSTPHKADEIALHDWVLAHRQNGFIVTRSAIRVQAQSTFKEPNFKASAGWCTNFMNRHGLSLRVRTKISQKLPAQLDDKITQFHRFVIDLRKNNDYDLSCIANMDETPVFFDLPGNRTVHPTGDKTVLVKTTGNEKNHFTAVLCVCADGTKLKPMLIFKRKTMPKEKFPSGVVIHVNEKGWMDKDAMYIWLQKVWAFRPGGLRQQRSMLVWDSFRAHLMEDVKNRTHHGYNTDLAVIPGGLTSVLQPLDVSVNKPFKDHLRGLWGQWLASGQAALTNAGNLKRPSLVTVAEWVKTAWNEISIDTIQHSFKKCGIANAMDGTEDDILWQEPADQGSEAEASDEDDDPHDDMLTQEQALQLFAESDEEDFYGFH